MSQKEPSEAAVPIRPPQATDPELKPGVLHAVRLLHQCADAIDRQQCGPRFWHCRLFGNLSIWAYRKAAKWLEHHVV